MSGRILNNRMLARCVTVLLLLFSLHHSQAQGVELVVLADPIYVRSLSGQVQDFSKSAVPNAHVEIFDVKTGKALASTSTDANGNFHFKNFGKSEYKLMVSMPGFNPLQATLRIQKDAPESAVLTLTIAT